MKKEIDMNRILHKFGGSGAGGFLLKSIDYSFLFSIRVKYHLGITCLVDYLVIQVNSGIKLLSNSLKCGLLDLGTKVV